MTLMHGERRNRSLPTVTQLDSVYAARRPIDVCDHPAVDPEAYRVTLAEGIEQPYPQN